MSFILTFLGKGGTGRSTVAIAAAKKLASLGQRVLLVSQDASPCFGLLLGIPVSQEPQEIAANLAVVRLATTASLEKNWENLKELESQYLRSPTLKNVYGQELGVLPAMDEAFALNSLRLYDKSNKYDTIVYDGTGDASALRMWGTAEILGWYGRRFRQVLSESDVLKAISPFIQPFTSAILNVSFSSDSLSGDTGQQATQLLEEARQIVSNPQRMAAYLVTDNNPVAVAAAKHLWGGSQQIGLSVAGVIGNRVTDGMEGLQAEFAPLETISLPTMTGNDWQPLIEAMPNLRDRASNAPPSLAIDANNRQVTVFLPGFDKKDVKLSQSGSEITIEAGGQRRNIILPDSLKGQSVKGAKFQNSYLIISL
jgi:anion-transporting  ArsA/GET3 family ATPase